MPSAVREMVCVLLGTICVRLFAACDVVVVMECLRLFDCESATVISSSSLGSSFSEFPFESSLEMSLESSFSSASSSRWSWCCSSSLSSWLESTAGSSSLGVSSFIISSGDRLSSTRYFPCKFLSAKANLHMTALPSLSQTGQYSHAVAW